MARPASTYVFDLATAVKALWLDTDPRTTSLGWLTASRDDPEGFERALFAYASSRHGSFKSDGGLAYDFFSDLCMRHSASNRVALSRWDGMRGRLESVTYRELEMRSRSLRSVWHRAGVQKGDCVAVVGSFGVEVAAAWLAALRMGLVLAPVAAVGKTFVQNRLSALDPARVFCSDALASWLGPFAERRLVAEARDSAPPLASGDAPGYARDAVVMRCVSPFIASPLTVVDVKAHDLFFGGLRDALLVLDAGEGRAVCWPGAEPGTELGLAVGTWLAGGSLVHVDAGDLEHDAQLLGRLGLDTLGVTAKVRDLVLTSRIELPKLRSWLRDPTEVFEWDPWDRFAQLAALSGARGGAACFAPTFGGSLFFTFKQKRPHLLQVLPMPGRAFALCDVLGGGVPTDGPSGVYAPLDLDEPEPVVGRFVIARDGDRHLLAGAGNACPFGVPYPHQELRALLASSGLVRAAASFTRATSGRLNDAGCVLVGFVDPRVAADASVLAGVRAELERLITTELGPGALPQRIDLHPLEPRFEGGVVDARWCESQWADGLLAKKTRHAVFRDLSRVRRVVAGLVKPA